MGCVLRYVYIDDTFVNDYLVKEGYAKASTYAPDVKFSEQFAASEREARENKRGLWGSACEVSVAPTVTSNALVSDTTEFVKKSTKCLISVKESDAKIFKALKSKKNTLLPFFKEKFLTANRQSFRKVFFPNGAIYIFYAKDFLKKKKINIKNSTPFVMNDFESIDIDFPYDFEIAKKLANKYLLYRNYKKK